ncbi:MAG: lysophospholipid transporter LplT [Betaproteobacteria bacterium]|nr:lysophospholipid transporter LplT [Betaproteobacteria bacterium]MBI2960655.1 lysophospholipid transporter LplT [Betaproteobacteria bacterium]
MKRGFYTIMAAQFFSSLADNALLIAAIALLAELSGPQWVVPLLKFFFTVSYVILAPFVGAFADSMPKGRVMFITNALKIVGCIMLLFYQLLLVPGLPAFVIVLVAYAVVGLGAAAYSPAKYGILTELLPPQQLVFANGWIEGLTVASIILGVLLGGALISPAVSHVLIAIDITYIDTGIDTPAEAAMPLIALVYLAAAIFNLFIPDTGAHYEPQRTNPILLARDFWTCFTTLWRDKLGQITLAVTTLFWGAGATLQFLVLRWTERNLGLPLSQGAVLQGVTALGIALGAVFAARFVPLRRSLSVLPVGVAMGIAVMLMAYVSAMPLVYLMLIVVGALAGCFVVPMNALLQHRGHVLLSAGHSIAVQNFNENLAILAMLAIYSGMIATNLGVHAIMVIFGLFVAGTMVLVMLRHRYNQSRGDSLHLIGMEKH